MEEQEKLKSKGSAGDHLANERTFLAWIRTSIGIMGFGFVVVKFSLFVRQITAVLGNKNVIPSAGYSPTIGIVLVGLGAFITLFSYTRYINTKNQLEAYNQPPGSGAGFFIRNLLAADLHLIQQWLLYSVTIHPNCSIN